MDEPLWRPSAARIANSHWTLFHAFWQGRDAAVDPDAQNLWQSSVDRPESFWRTFWDYAGIVAETTGDTVLENAGAMPGARWFPGARLNFAENLLASGDPATPAIVFRGEDGSRRSLTYHELRLEVARLAAAMRADGVTIGDRVAGYLPNLPEAVVAMLATASLGAVWSSCSPDFGINGVLDRFGQIEPRLLITVDGYRYAGKRIDLRAKVAEIASALPSLVRTIVVPFLDDTPDLTAIPGVVAYPGYLAPGFPALDCTQFPFDHPLYVLYSSGTTGMPKAIVHGAGGTLLQQRKEHLLHSDLRAGERLFYFTTCGWMMWNWLVSGLATGATLILFDGSPLHPDADMLWTMAEEEGVEIFGTSARYIDGCKKAGLAPARTHDLPRLRAILSTGSPLLPESFDYVYGEIKADVHLASISGGTDIVSCFVLGNPAAPVWRGEIQTRGLGLAVDIWDDDGRPIRQEKGELVCTAPFPCMPVGFWNDPDGSRYRKAYFERFPGVWHHGDYAELTAHDGLVIHGRSDAVLNPGGVRIGTAEIYRQVEQTPEVLEALCIGQDWQGDVRVVLFVRLRDGVVLEQALQDAIRRRIRDNCTPRHVPARIVAVADIPRTMSGKISELAVRDVVHGRAVKNTDALANPAALDLFRDLPALAS